VHLSASLGGCAVWRQGTGWDRHGSLPNVWREGTGWDGHRFLPKAARDSFRFPSQEIISQTRPMDDPQEVVAWGPIDGEPPVGLDVRAEHPTMVDAFDKAAVSTPLHALPSRITPSHFSLICPLRLLTLLRAIDSRAHSGLLRAALPRLTLLRTADCCSRLSRRFTTASRLVAASSKTPTLLAVATTCASSAPTRTAAWPSTTPAAHAATAKRSSWSRSGGTHPS
jgi:hypothetical protein